MSSFKANRIAPQLLARTPEMVAQMKARAEAAAAVARSIAPVGKSKSGEHYRDMIEADAGIVDGRATGRVNAKKFTSGFIEFGTQKTRAHAVLRRAVESLGLRFRANR